jgi:hypothetical protein
MTPPIAAPVSWGWAAYLTFGLSLAALAFFAWLEDDGPEDRSGDPPGG